MRRETRLPPGPQPIAMQGLNLGNGVDLRNRRLKVVSHSHEPNAILVAQHIRRPRIAIAWLTDRTDAANRGRIEQVPFVAELRVRQVFPLVGFTPIQTRDVVVPAKRDAVYFINDSLQPGRAMDVLGKDPILGVARRAVKLDLVFVTLDEASCPQKVEKPLGLRRMCQLASSPEQILQQELEGSDTMRDWCESHARGRPGGYSIRQASANVRRGLRGCSRLGSP